MIPIAVQLYSLRDAGPLAAQLAMVRAAGLAEVELHSANFAEPAETRAALDAAGLRARSGHVGLGRLEDPGGLAAAARVLGLSDIVLWGFDEEDLGPDPETWRAKGRLVGDAAMRLADHGTTLSFHNHDWELRPFGDEIALDLMFDAAGDALCWQADIAWLERGGADVAAILSRHGHRLRSAHLKDLAFAGTIAEEGWADLGHGTLDWNLLMRQIERLEPTFLALEHDAPDDPARFLARSAETARRLLGEAVAP